ncbi:helix-turn-helix domain-containing protein [Paenibacillus sp. TAB 01]|uniref:helix-turn-helix domain-containing protein n=1 Tax=Paenibacillus sp. TAB 01 TaxID=3368988 RepID=UPI00375150F2
MNIPSHRIRTIRRAKELSGTEIADKLGISAQYYYNIERGKRNLSADVAAGLSKIFNVSADYLLGLSDDQNASVPTDQIIAEKQEPYYAITAKDEKDIAKKLEAMMEELDSDSALSFLGEPMDEEDRELLRISLENTLRMSREMAKKKFTPKKYRK